MIQYSSGYDSRFPRKRLCFESQLGTTILYFVVGGGGWAHGDNSKQYGIFFTLSIQLDMSHGMRKSVFGVKDQVRHKMGYTAIEAS